jgi:chromosome segregation protein
MKLEFVEMVGFRGFRDKIRFQLHAGFAVLSGRNGTGKSTLLDAIDFALTGNINKFAVKEARGGGLEQHIWWVGDGKPEAYYVSVGFVGDDGERFTVTRTRERGNDRQSSELMARLTTGSRVSSLETLMQTSLIRDELIAALSLDLPEQARFAAVRAAIGGMVGPDYSDRTASILSAANSAKIRQDERIKEVQAELGRSLGELTEARSSAERSSGISDALRVVSEVLPDSPERLADRTEAVRTFVAERRVAIREAEAARSLAGKLSGEFQFWTSNEGQKRIELALIARDAAAKEKGFADERLLMAVQLQDTERASDEYAAHLSALLDHGRILGLHDGHCPLCNAAQTQAEFDSAIDEARGRLADRGERLAKATARVMDAQGRLSEAQWVVADADGDYTSLLLRRETYQQRAGEIAASYARSGLTCSPDDLSGAQAEIFAQRENLVRLERALSVLEASNSIDRIRAIESRIATLRERSELEAARLSSVEKAIDLARQIDAAGRTVANQILTEQFDTVMPLLKEFYRRLRPHADWAEIESDFGGKVRGSLNFTVGNGHNPQFLFSSGQRRAAGLAFLLAIHLSRPWCKWRTLLMDDPVQHIDDYRSLNLVEVLAAIRRTGRQVIVAVEDPALADVLCRRLRSATGDAGRHFVLRISESGTSVIDKAHDIYPMPRLVLRPAQAS